MTFYLDTSVLVPLFVLERRTVAIREWLATLTEPLVVGQLATVEVGSAIARKCHAGELAWAEAGRALAAFDQWLAVADIVEHDRLDFMDAATLVRRPLPKLLPADAIHLATARRLGLALVTDDGGLQEVAALNAIAWLRPA